MNLYIESGTVYCREQHLPCGVCVILHGYQVGIIEDPSPTTTPKGNAPVLSSIDRHIVHRG